MGNAIFPTRGEAADENNQSISCMISYLEQRQKQNAIICE